MLISRNFARLIVLLIAAGLGLPASAANSNAATIKIALLAPMTGGVAFFGDQATKGAQLEVLKWNASGGVLGQMIEIVPFDSMCNATQAAERANEVVAQGIHYIVGEICSSASVAVSNIAEANGIIQISPSSTNLAVTVDNNSGLTKNYVFRACFIDAYQGEMMARFALEQGFDKIFLLSDPNNSYTMGLYSSFKATFTALGGQIAGDLTYDPNAADYSGLINTIKGTNPDAVYLPDFYTVTNKIASQAKTGSLLVPFMGGDGWDSSSLDLGATDGSFFTNHFSLQDTRPEVQQFVTDYKAANAGADPSAVAALTADALNILVNAIAQANVDDPDVVKEQLMANVFHTVTGKVVFNSQHNPTKNLVINRVASDEINFYQSYLPNGSISGNLLKTDGSPITDHPIYVKVEGTTPGADTKEVLVSSTDGSYSIQDLFPGSYKLVGNSQNTTQYTTVYYLNHLNSDLATAIDVSANQNLLLSELNSTYP